jgi:diguanylate cyclase (GGDEF)-like protein
MQAHEIPWLALASFSVLLIAAGVVAACWLLRARDEESAGRHASRAHGPHDPLTGLPTRIAIAETAAALIGQARAADARLALLVLSVDRLKPINESLGHEAGDQLLCELVRRLRAVLRRNDALGRLAGDEFVVVAGQAQSAQDIETITNKILAALREPFTLQTRAIHVSLTIGASSFPQDGADYDLLLRRAETAMRTAKAAGRGSFRRYSVEMRGLADDRLALESDLRSAIEMDELELHYQPKVDILSNRVRSAEALVRWRHPERGLVPPNAFIPIAEETGLILPIGEWVLRTACRQVRGWIDAGLPPVRVAVNLSPQQFRHADLQAVVKSALADAELEPGFLELELTESSVMHDPEKSTATLERLSQMGVHISIDDFGTGYSSLSYLRRFPLDKLKIDRSFVRDLMSNRDDASIVKAIISLAHNLRLRVVAEGVETREQFEFLRDLGCDQYQGYYCSPAVPPAKFVELLQRSRAERPEYTEADMLRTQSRLSAYVPSSKAASS